MERIFTTLSFDLFKIQKPKFGSFIQRIHEQGITDSLVNIRQKFVNSLKEMSGLRTEKLAETLYVT